MLTLAGCAGPLPPKQKIQPFPGADPTVSIAPVACNLLIDNAEFGYRARVRSLFQSFQDRLYGIPPDADWGRIEEHFQKQLTGKWEVVDSSPELERAYRSVTWRSDGWPARYLSVALLTRRGCLADLPFKLLIVSIPRGGQSLD
ncbi:hypothetical protein [Shinella sp.]|uniref:hypothetical protein n=1 Tax=Shinella sp. TaxID=1870904 RepID=UPI0039E35806